MIERFNDGCIADGVNRRQAEGKRRGLVYEDGRVRVVEQVRPSVEEERKRGCCEMALAEDRRRLTHSHRNLTLTRPRAQAA
jgi:hypothetical protein